MKEKINAIRQAIELFIPSDAKDIENFRIEYLSKKGAISLLFQDFRNVPSEDKRQIGQDLNDIRLLFENDIRFLNQFSSSF